MSARSARRRFAAPFVVTIAACGGTAPKPEPVHANPPPPPEMVTTGGDPSATGDPCSAGDPAPETHAATPDDREPDGPKHVNPPGPHKNPPPPRPEPTDAKDKPAPAAQDQRWTVLRIKGRADCLAHPDANCPKPPPGVAVSCNPPPPVSYACPDGLAEGASLKIVLRAGATACFVEQNFKCPEVKPGEARPTCNPPAPRKVACPGK